MRPTDQGLVGLYMPYPQQRFVAGSKGSDLDSNRFASANKWYAVHAKTSQEDLAAFNLGRLKLEVLNPKVKHEKVVWGERGPSCSRSPQVISLLDSTRRNISTLFSMEGESARF